MQQTNTYKLNLIEKNDPFSPDPLNENAQKVEAALHSLDSGKAGLTETTQYFSSLAGRVGALESGKADAAETANLNGRVAVLEARHIAIGSYKGDGTAERTIALGFTPETVLAITATSGGGSTHVYLMVRGDTQSYQKIVEGGFSVTSKNALNNTQSNCGYIAIA